MRRRSKRRYAAMSIGEGGVPNAEIEVLPAVSGGMAPLAVPDEDVIVPLPKLKFREKRFCELFLLEYNVVSAVQGSGLTPRKDQEEFGLSTFGHAILARSDISAYITARKSELLANIQVSQQRIREEVAAIAFSDAGKFVEMATDRDGKPTGEIGAIRLDRADTRGVASLQINETKNGEQRVNIRMHSKIDALKMLGKDAGMFEEENKSPPASASTST